ncbi:MAG: hypothetical protein ACI8YQ_000208 [Polaribacter sp.]
MSLSAKETSFLHLTLSLRSNSKTGIQPISLLACYFSIPYLLIILVLCKGRWAFYSLENIGIMKQILTLVTGFVFCCGLIGQTVIQGYRK